MKITVDLQGEALEMVDYLVAWSIAEVLAYPEVFEGADEKALRYTAEYFVGEERFAGIINEITEMEQGEES